MDYKATVTSKGQITIPIAVREQLKINQKDIISFSIQGDRAVMTKVEIEAPCKCKNNDCIVCLNTKKINFSIPFFAHVTKVKKKLGYQLQVNFIGTDNWKVVCHERKLTNHEESTLNEWLRRTIDWNE